MVPGDPAIAQHKIVFLATSDGPTGIPCQQESLTTRVSLENQMGSGIWM